MSTSLRARLRLSNLTDSQRVEENWVDIGALAILMLLFVGSALIRMLWWGQDVVGHADNIMILLSLMCLGVLTFNLNHKVSAVLRRRTHRRTGKGSL